MAKGAPPTGITSRNHDHAKYLLADIHLLSHPHMLDIGAGLHTTVPPTPLHARGLGTMG